MAEKSLSVDVVADVVCPWCYLGWARLQKALALRPGLPAQVVWKAYQLNPDLPEEGVDYKEYIAKKFDPERIREAQANIRALGEEIGLVFNFDRIQKAPNTSAAHRLIRWGAAEGKLDDIARGVMKAYFTDGRFIGDARELAAIGAAAGMNGDDILARFERGLDKDIIARENAEARARGVAGVPFYLLGGHIAVEGSWPAEDLATELDRARAA
jgi:predicted DsbA family dithiol-disulfide isomerase